MQRACTCDAKRKRDCRWSVRPVGKRWKKGLSRARGKSSLRSSRTAFGLRWRRRRSFSAPTTGPDRPVLPIFAAIVKRWSLIMRRRSNKVDISEPFKRACPEGRAFDVLGQNERWWKIYLKSRCRRSFYFIEKVSHRYQASLKKFFPRKRNLS